jgi:hypothetical protein
MLAERCVAILYRGAPCHQESYAYKIPVHVGPVLGWQPPPVPGYVRPHRRGENWLRRFRDLKNRVGASMQWPRR